MLDNYFHSCSDPDIDTSMDSVLENASSLHFQSLYDVQYGRYLLVIMLICFIFSLLLEEMTFEYSNENFGVEPILSINTCLCY